MPENPLIRPEDESFLTQESLTNLFEELVQKSFQGTLHMADREVIDYVAKLLTRFTLVENLYSIRDIRGKTLYDVGEMLLASNPLLDGPSFDFEREVRKHIGDFTLFFAGLFPESINQWRLRREKLDAFIDYIRTGKESYFIVSEFNQFEYKSSAPLFKKMSEEFERCVFGLNLVKRELHQMQQGSYIRVKKLLT